MLSHVRSVVRFATFVLLLFGAAGVSAQGMLIPGDTSLQPLELRSHQVEFDITDNGAVTHITQVFRNHTSQQLEATYYFAIPEGAVTTDFALWMNGERITGEVLPRGQARQIYEGIVRRMRDPGLLEWVSGDLFQASIFPIPPNGDQTVEIEYASVLARDGNMLRYTYPMHESAGSAVHQMVISGNVRSSSGIANLYSPHHNIDVRSDSNRFSRVAYEETNGSTARDFDLFIGLSSDDVGFSFITHDPDDNEDGYFMMTLSPSSELSDLEVLPKQVTFVIDTSGSMAGVKIQQARDMLSQVVDALREGDTFNVISFSTGVTAAFDDPMPVNRDNLRAAHGFIDNLGARGNTNISGALSRALADETSEDRPHVIVFITDGLPTEGNTDVDAIIRIARDGAEDASRRIFTFGVGYDVNTRLLDGVARRGRGQSGYVRPEETLGDAVGTFFAGVDAPLLTNLELDFGRTRVTQIYPNPLPDLYRGGQVTVFGRYRANSSESLTIRGRAGRETIELVRYPEYADFAETDKSFIANLWARRRVDELLAQIEESGHNQGTVDEVVGLATRWGIVTPYTSYLALDPSEREFARQFGREDNNAEPMPDRIAAAPRGPVRGGGGSSNEAFAFDEAEISGSLGATGGSVRTHSGAGAGATRSRPSAAPAPVAAQSAPRAESGRDAVEESIRRNREVASTTVDSDSRAASRSAAGRSFAVANGVWVESGLESANVDRTVDYLSDEYFALLSENPAIADILALGQRVRFRLDGRVIEVR